MLTKLYRFSIAVCCALTLVIIPSVKAEEKITITTYYPSPSGNFNLLEANDITATNRLYLGHNVKYILSKGPTYSVFKTWEDPIPNVTADFADSDLAFFTPVHTTGTGGQGNETSDLRLYVLDNSDDRFSIWGNTCGTVDGGTPCYSLSNAKNIATFRGDGNIGFGVTEPETNLHILGSSQSLTGDKKAGVVGIRAFNTDKDGNSIILAGVYDTTTTNQSFNIGKAGKNFTWKGYNFNGAGYFFNSDKSPIHFLQDAYTPADPSDAIAMTITGNKTVTIGSKNLNAAEKFQVLGRIMAGPSFGYTDNYYKNITNKSNADFGILFSSKGSNLANPSLWHPAGRIYGDSTYPDYAGDPVGWDDQTLVLEAANGWGTNAPSPFDGTTTLGSFNTYQLALKGDGNIGIGMREPKTTLDVNGEIALKNRAFMVYANPGVNGQMTNGIKFNCWWNTSKNADVYTNYGPAGIIAFDNAPSFSPDGNWNFYTFSTGSQNANVSGGLRMRIQNDGTIVNYTKFYIAPSAQANVRQKPTYDLQLQNNSAFKPGGNTWSTSSDARVKKDIVSFTDGLDVLNKIRPIKYKYNGKGGTPLDSEGIGVIAQEIKEVAPYTIKTYKAKLEPTDTEDTELLSFDSSALTFVMINAIKEQQAQIDALKAEIEKLKK